MPMNKSPDLLESQNLRELAQRPDQVGERLKIVRALELLAIINPTMPEEELLKLLDSFESE